MSVLSGLRPEGVFRYFEELCAIPHGSGNTKQISDRLVAFARERGLKYRQEACNNVIIWKDASPGYENAPTVMIQGHMDMVCEKEADCSKDMDREGLDLMIDGEYIGAKGTTLGGDDGIAVAIALAILDADDIPHGPLECLFTVDEEIGLLGAQALDASDLKARYLLNLDSEAEGVLTVSCAGSIRQTSVLPVTRTPWQGQILKLTLGGLAGGHSGEEIHLGRANADILMGRALTALARVCEYRLIDVTGGAKDNAIPRSCVSAVVIPPEKLPGVMAAMEKLDADLKTEYRTPDGGIFLTAETAEDDRLPMDEDSTRRVAALLFCVPDGVQAMSADVPGLVQTSLNLGRVFTAENEVTFGNLLRSSVDSQNWETHEKVKALTEALGGSVRVATSYSAWPYQPDSKLRETMIRAFRNVYGSEPKVEALHAGLECGILSGKLPGLDCVSFGPDLKEIHTPRERLHIASTGRVWELTLETLKLLK